MRINKIIDIQHKTRVYIKSGVYSRAARCLEQLMYIGQLSPFGYLRLANIYRICGEDNKVQRVISRYKAIYK